MSKYDPWADFFAKQTAEHISASFSELEKKLNTKLPASAFEHPAWWANYPGKTHVQARAWLDAGYETSQVDMTARRLIFRRVKPDQEKNSSPGLSESHRMFKTEENIEKKSRRSPLFGALKGTFSIEPGWDLTKPALDADELAEMEANIERTADLIDHGMSGKHK
jgi:hypothetical protein